MLDTIFILFPAAFKETIMPAKHQKLSKLIFFLLTTAVFSVTPTVIAQEKPSGKAQANLSQTQMKEFVRLDNQGADLLQNRDYAKARMVLEQACKLCPNSVDTQSSLAFTCGCLGNNEEAIVHYKQALAIEPDNAQIILHISISYAYLGNIKESRIWLQKVIDSKTADSSLIATAKNQLQTFKNIHEDTFESGNKTSLDYFDLLIEKKLASRWPSNKMPLKVFFESGTAIQYYRPEYRTMLVNAFNEWTATSGAKLSWTETSHKDDADIVCNWQRDPDKSSSEPGKTWVYPDFERSNGITGIQHATITIFTMRPNRITAVGMVPINDTEARETCLHEVGHALGLCGHSPNANDIMWACGSIYLSGLSARDKNTIFRLYSNGNK